MSSPASEVPGNTQFLATKWKALKNEEGGVGNEGRKGGRVERWERSLSYRLAEQPGKSEESFCHLLGHQNQKRR